MHPERLRPDDPRLPATLDLIRRAFSEHDGRIDPPSSMHRLTLADLNDAASASEVWVVGEPPLACVILAPKGETLYLSKLAVAAAERGKGHARRLIERAARRATELGLNALELQTRVELTENHAAFRRLGFVKIGTTKHPGFDRPTSIRMRKTL